MLALQDFILSFLLIGGGIFFTTAIIYNALYPIYKIKQIKQQVVLKFKLNTFHGFDKYSSHDLPLGQLGIVTGRLRLDSASSRLYHFYKAEVIIPELTDSGELILHSTRCTVVREPSGIPRIIFLKLLRNSRIRIDNDWYGEKDIHKAPIPVSSKLNSVEKVRYRAAQELAPLIKELCELELEIVRIDSECRKAKRLLNLITTSEVYRYQRDTYETMYSDINRILSKAQELEQLYRRFIRESLIGVQLAINHPTMLSMNNLSIQTIEAQYEKQKEEYLYMKDKLAAYANLLNTQI